MIIIITYALIWQSVFSQETTEKSCLNTTAQKIIPENYSTTSASVFYGSRYDMQDHENSIVSFAASNIKQMIKIPSQQIPYKINLQQTSEINPGFWYGAYAEFQAELAKSQIPQKK